MSHGTKDYVWFGISGLGESGRFWGLDNSLGGRPNPARTVEIY
jgi:hypothetical protein